MPCSVEAFALRKQLFGELSFAGVLALTSHWGLPLSAAIVNNVNIVFAKRQPQ
jgi:hypothetical protein